MAGLFGHFAAIHVPASPILFVDPRHRAGMMNAE
jgi:hypothetical protein